MVDAGCDELGKVFLSDPQPPALSYNEVAVVTAAKGGSANTMAQRPKNFKITPKHMVRLVREGVARLTVEDSKAIVYHCLDNSREFHGAPLQPLEFELDDAPALEMILQTTSPHWICVEDLLMDDIEDKLEIAQSLYDEGILSVLVN
jgi:lysine-specific demethylase/histidyl-hydroxylase NO66